MEAEIDGCVWGLWRNCSGIFLFPMRNTAEKLWNSASRVNVIIEARTLCRRGLPNELCSFGARSENTYYLTLLQAYSGEENILTVDYIWLARCWKEPEWLRRQEQTHFYRFHFLLLSSNTFHFERQWLWTNSRGACLRAPFHSFTSLHEADKMTGILYYCHINGG